MPPSGPTAESDTASRERGERGIGAVRRRLPLLLGTGAGIAVCALSLLLLSLVRGQSATPATPLPAATGAVQAMCADLRAQDYAALYGALASDLRTEGTAAQFAASQRQLDIALGVVTRCSAVVTDGDNGEAGVQFSLTRGHGGQASATGHLVFEGGAWRLDAYDAQLVHTAAAHSV
jgi:hypothetical protein